MVETQSKSAIQAPPVGPPVRVPSKRTFSETQNVPQKQPAVEQAREVKATQRRRSIPPQPTLDAKTMMKLVPNLSERELKQLVNTIIRRKKREEGAKNRRPSGPTPAREQGAAPRGVATRTDNQPATILPHPERPLIEPESATGEPTLGPGGPLSSSQQMEEKTQRGSFKTEEPDLAGALLRQASRQFFSIIVFHT